MRWLVVIALFACSGRAARKVGDAQAIDRGPSHPCTSFDPAQRTLTPQEARMSVVPWPCPDAAVSDAVSAPDAAVSDDAR